MYDSNHTFAKNSSSRLIGIYWNVHTLVRLIEFIIYYFQYLNSKAITFHGLFCGLQESLNNS